jgi:hypothetical protein
MDGDVFYINITFYISIVYMYILTKMSNAEVKSTCVSIRTPGATLYLQTNTPTDRKSLAPAASNKSDTANLPLVHT